MGEAGHLNSVPVKQHTLVVGDPDELNIALGCSCNPHNAPEILPSRLEHSACLLAGEQVVNPAAGAVLSRQWYSISRTNQKKRELAELLIESFPSQESSLPRLPLRPTLDPCWLY